MRVSMQDLFFPKCCPVCDYVVGKDEIICHDCMLSLPRTEESWQRGNLTEEPFHKINKFVRGASFLFFEKDTPMQDMLHKMKYGRFANPQIGYVLGKEATYEFLQSDFFDGIEIIIPVPLHPNRYRQRGFNQAEWIGRGISEATGIPLDTTHLKRIQDNAHQTQTIGMSREKNVEGIFAVNHPEELYRKHILLVDDVITTGATLLSCINALKPVKNCQISVFGLGKTR